MQSGVEESSDTAADACRRRACSVTRAESAFSCRPNRLSPRIARSSSRIAGSALPRSCSLRSACRSNSAADRTFPLPCVGSASRNTDAMNSLTSSARVFLGQRHPRLPRHHTRADQERREHGCSCTDGECVPRDELADAIPEAVRLRQHRSCTEIAFDIVEQGVDRRVPRLRRLLESPEHDRVEIAAQRFAPLPLQTPRSVAQGRPARLRLPAPRGNPASVCTAVDRRAVRRESRPVNRRPMRWSAARRGFARAMRTLASARGRKAR